MNKFTRNASAAAGISFLLAAVIPGVSNAVDNYPPGSKAVSCSASATSHSSKIKVNVGPDQPGNRYYVFQVQRQRKNGSIYSYSGLVKTQGIKETRTINVPKGTYRVQCLGKYGFASSTSRTISIKK